jgi:hypothetical protein
VLFDDDTVHECKTEDILALKGGGRSLSAVFVLFELAVMQAHCWLRCAGDYDMASMLFYRAKQE